MNTIKEYTEKKGNICMVGDGVNDSLALKSAYTSIVIGGIGSDIAVKLSDVILVTDSVEKIPYLIKLSGTTLKRININISFAVPCNIIAVILSFLGILTSITAALVHNFGSVAVVISSTLILTYKNK